MLENEFMRLALGAGAIVGVLAPAVGFFLVQRRQSLMGDGIGHVAFAGVAAGILLDVSPVLTALVAAVLGGLAIELLRSRGRTAGDQALAIVFYTGIALGVVLVAQAGALNVDLFQYLFGSILTVTRSDLAVIAVLGAVGLVTVATLYRAFAAIVIDEEGARVAGVPIGTLNVALATLTAVTVALSMRVVGILLVAALMVLPVSAAARIAWSMRSTLVLAMAIGLGSGQLRPDPLVLRGSAARRHDRARGGGCVPPRASGEPCPRQALGMRDISSLRGDERRAYSGLVTVATPSLVLLGGPHHDRLARVRRRQSVHETLRRRRRATAPVTDRLQLVHELGMRQELRHRSEREPPEVLVEPCHDDPHAVTRELERMPDDRMLEELDLVDPDDVESRRACGHVLRRRDRDGTHSCARMAHDVRRVVPVVDVRLQDHDALARDLGAAQPADHLLALSTEHRTADDLEPATALRGDADHGGDRRVGVGGHRWRGKNARRLAMLSRARRRSSVG